MSKLLPLLLGSFFITIIATKTYANSNNFDSTIQNENTLHDLFDNSKNVLASNFELTINFKNNSKFDSKTEIGVISSLFSKLLKKCDLIPEPFNEYILSMPKSFEPNIEFDQLLEIEVLGISKLVVKIFNNWGVQVAESTFKNKLTKNEVNNLNSKKLSLNKNAKSGIKSNKELLEGSYFYSIYIRCHSGEKITKEGEIRLLRTQRK
jgi:hypothetical protein